MSQEAQDRALTRGPTGFPGYSEGEWRVQGTGSTQKSLQQFDRAMQMLYSAMVHYGRCIENVAGANRIHLVNAAHDLEEAAQALGVLPQRVIPRPTSQWPEGEGDDDAL